MRTMLSVVMGICVLMGLAACQPLNLPQAAATQTASPEGLTVTGPTETAAPTRAGETTITETPQPQETTMDENLTLDADTQKLVDLAKEHLAGKLRIATNQISLFEVEAVEWRDSSLGCPQKGMMYTQVITPGYRMLLEAQGKTYKYHTDRGRQVVLCELRAPGEIFQTP